MVITRLAYGTTKNTQEKRPWKTDSFSLCDSPMEKMSMYLDSFLQQLAQKVDSYIKDTTHFLSNLSHLGQLDTNSLLVTIDIVSLYTNIPHRNGILATKGALETRTTKEPKTWVLLRLLHFILTKTAFKFNNKFYEQISGTTMGTKCAPSYAIISGFYRTQYPASYTHKSLGRTPQVTLPVSCLLCLSLKSQIPKLFHNDFGFSHIYSLSINK